MSTVQERIPREWFEEVFSPVIRKVGAKNLIIRLNAAAKLAIPRQTKLAQLMPKLEILCYEQKRPKVEEEMEKLWSLFFEERLGEKREKFFELSDELNKYLDQDKVPEDAEKRAAVKKVIQDIAQFLEQADFSPREIEITFRLKAFNEVLELFLAERKPAS